MKIKTIFKSVLLLAVVFALSGCGVNKDSGYKVDLEIWGIFDDSDDYLAVFNDYRTLNPHVGDITYRKFTIENYRQDLLDAMASGKGPDIFMVHNTWAPSFASKTEPSPKEVITPQDFERSFVDVVAKDFVSPDGKIYAVPLSVDSLALFYNKDLLNAAGIAYPPQTWEEFYNAVIKLTKKDSNGNIYQSGAAIGTAAVNRSTDILTLMMMQMGSEMLTEDGSKTAFDQAGAVSSQKALELYTEFARSGTQAYAWNKTMRPSTEAFARGEAAMMINYSWQIEALESANAKLNFGVAPVPQWSLNKKMNFANYWGYSVSKFKEPGISSTTGQLSAIPNRVRTLEAWQFLKYLTIRTNGNINLINAASGNSQVFAMKMDPAIEYLKQTGKPAARRDILELQKGDSVLAPFAEGNLMARSWMQPDADAVEKIFYEMIDSVNRNGSSIPDAITQAGQRVTQMMQKR